MPTAAAGASAIHGSKKGNESDAKHGEERRRRVCGVDFGDKTIGGLDDVMDGDRPEHCVQNYARRRNRI
jgi:hypothetical protein